MKTSTKLFIGMAVVTLVFVSVGTVSADTIDIGPGNGGFGRGISEEDDGQLADYMEAVIAESLGLTVEELNALEADGTTHLDIALDKGFTVEEFDVILDNAREEAIALAAADGITIQSFGMNADGLGQFSKTENGIGQYGSGLREDEPQGIGLRAEDGTSDGFGNRMMIDDCEEETCTAQPIGTGIGRGGRR